jgi:hypothetical protein
LANFCKRGKGKFLIAAALAGSMNIYLGLNTK